MIDLTKWKKKWISSLNMFLVEINDPDMIIYAVVDRNLIRRKVIKVKTKNKWDKLEKK